MPTKEKIEAVEEMAELLKSSKAIYLADFSGLDVPSFTELRKKLYAEQVSFVVVKNRLAKLAAAKAGVVGLDDSLVGPTGLVCTSADPIAPAKLLADFAKTKDGKPRVKMGLFDGQIFVEDQIEALAQLPSREVLLTQIVTGLQSPITGLVFALSGILKSLVGTLQALVEKKQSDEA